MRGVPLSGATAVTMNVTLTDASGPGFVTVWRSGTDRPLSSSLNAEIGASTVVNLVTVPVGPDGKVNLFTQTGDHLLADISGWVPQVVYVPKMPTRVLDTRDGPNQIGYIGAKHGADATVDLQIIGVAGIQTWSTPPPPPRDASPLARRDAHCAAPAQSTAQTGCPVNPSTTGSPGPRLQEPDMNNTAAHDDTNATNDTEEGHGTVDGRVAPAGADDVEGNGVTRSGRVAPTGADDTEDHKAGSNRIAPAGGDDDDVEGHGIKPGTDGPIAR